MASGMAASTRKWYYAHILEVLRKYGKASVPTIIGEMRKIPQSRYPLSQERIVALLKEMRALGIVAYYPSAQRKIASKWEITQDK
jgi:hypothetical protein